MASIQGVGPVLFVHALDSFPGHRAVNVADIAADRSRLAGSSGLSDRVLKHPAISPGRSGLSMRGHDPVVAPHAVGRPTVQHDRNGSGLQVLTDGSANRGFPSWSPDGRQIVYRAAGGEHQGLVIITVETGEIRPLMTGSSRDNFPAWSPKGDRIAFTRFSDNDYELYSIKPDGTDLRRLTNAPGNDAHCTWSPDGEWLAFTSARGGFKDEAALHPGNPQPYGDVYVMRADGSEVRQLTDTPFEEGTVAWRPMPR